MIAYCWSSGLIDFGRTLPDGALPIARGPARALRPFIQVTARHGYDGKTMLVPGVPEAENESAKLDALLAHVKWLAKRPPQGVVVGRKQ